MRRGGQDTFQTQTLQSPTGQGPRFRPFASAVHHVTKGRYITSNDPRGYIPVYEYPLNNQWIMMDIDDGYILWTGIWKADIVKMIDSQPELASVIRRVRGGYLKIQGTWMPFEVALRLARRVAWNIREDLIPLFGPTFPSTCLAPDQPGYGQVVASASGRRRARRTAQPALAPSIGPAHDPSKLASGTQQQQVFLQQLSPFAPVAQGQQYGTTPIYPVDLQVQAQGMYSPASQHSHASMERYGPSTSAPPPRDRHRFAPYPPAGGPSSMPPPRRPSHGGLSLEIPALARHDAPRTAPSGAGIQLPAIQPPMKGDGPAVYALPPISALEDLRGLDTQDSAAVLRRLQADDDASSSSVYSEPGTEPAPTRRAFSAPAPK
ncbi:hypothetical protein FB451DRAFT_1037179 [Mycena latifolia]|nr:hypothetical protein FB451DRAFT_1037179 [Mycena latifolia]